ncbi:MAG: TolC family protein [Mizugakiibacter sp.]|uniref:TolC family protein n=1 Tax=Rhodanobacteraceae TaxID=1775411 RepID=UPI0029669283|nr:TolC family protein [Rhodanobacter sp. KK11]MCE5232299.1 TolC family protein [Xanthomonadaceae bacterium]MDW2982453.1 TolC family protein [Rhodanobacter sp. KK11]
MQRVWQVSPEVQASRADRDAARARARAAAQPLYNPSITLDAENADVNRRTAGISLPLDLSGKRRARASQGDAQLRAAEATYDVRRRDVAARWLKAWSTAALATQQSALGERRLALMKRFDDLAAQRLKVGDISSPERDLAGLALGEAQVQQATLAANEAAARAALQAVSGDQLTTLPPLPDSLSPAADSMTPIPVDELPELRQARGRQASAEAGVQVARRARIPDPTLSLTGGQVRSGPRTDQVIGVSVSIPLPVLNTGRAEVDAALAEADAAAADVRSRQFVLRAGLQETQARYTALRGAAEAFRGGRAAAFEDRTALLEKLWRAGEISTSDYLVQLKQSLDTALSGLALESQAWQAWFDYLTAAGRLTDWVDGRIQDASP